MAKPAAVALVTEVIRCSQGDVAVPNSPGVDRRQRQQNQDYSMKTEEGSSKMQGGAGPGGCFQELQHVAAHMTPRNIIFSRNSTTGFGYCNCKSVSTPSIIHQPLYTGCYNGFVDSYRNIYQPTFIVCDGEDLLKAEIQFPFQQGDHKQKKIKKRIVISRYTHSSMQLHSPQAEEGGDSQTNKTNALIVSSHSEEEYYSGHLHQHSEDGSPADIQSLPFEDDEDRKTDSLSSRAGFLGPDTLLHREEESIHGVAQTNNLFHTNNYGKAEPATNSSTKRHGENSGRRIPTRRRSRNTRKKKKVSEEVEKAFTQIKNQSPTGSHPSNPLFAKQAAAYTKAIHSSEVEGDEDQRGNSSPPQYSEILEENEAGIPDSVPVSSCLGEVFCDGIIREEVRKDGLAQHDHESIPRVVNDDAFGDERVVGDSEGEENEENTVVYCEKNKEKKQVNNKKYESRSNGRGTKRRSGHSSGAAECLSNKVLKVQFIPVQVTGGDISSPTNRDGPSPLLGVLIHGNDDRSSSSSCGEALVQPGGLITRSSQLLDGENGISNIPCGDSEDFSTGNVSSQQHLAGSYAHNHEEAFVDERRFEQGDEDNSQYCPCSSDHKTSLDSTGGNDSPRGPSTVQSNGNTISSKLTQQFGVNNAHNFRGGESAGSGEPTFFCWREDYTQDNDFHCTRSRSRGYKIDKRRQKLDVIEDDRNIREDSEGKKEVVEDYYAAYSSADLTDDRWKSPLQNQETPFLCEEQRTGSTYGQIDTSIHDRTNCAEKGVALRSGRFSTIKETREAFASGLKKTSYIRKLLLSMLVWFCVGFRAVCAQQLRGGAYHPRNSGLFTTSDTIDSLHSDGRSALYPGQCLVSGNGLYKLCLQSSGELMGVDYTGLVFYFRDGGYAVESCILEADGSFVCYDLTSDRAARWTTDNSSSSIGGKYRLTLQNDRNIVIYDSTTNTELESLMNPKAITNTTRSLNKKALATASTQTLGIIFAAHVRLDLIPLVRDLHLVLHVRLDIMPLVRDLHRVLHVWLGSSLVRDLYRVLHVRLDLMPLVRDLDRVLHVRKELMPRVRDLYRVQHVRLDLMPRVRDPDRVQHVWLGSSLLPDLDRVLHVQLEHMPRVRDLDHVLHVWLDIMPLVRDLYRVQHVWLGSIPLRDLYYVLHVRLDFMPPMRDLGRVLHVRLDLMPLARDLNHVLHVLLGSSPQRDLDHVLHVRLDLMPLVQDLDRVQHVRLDLMPLMRNLYRVQHVRLDLMPRVRDLNLVLHVLLGSSLQRDPDHVLHVRLDFMPRVRDLYRVLHVWLGSSPLRDLYRVLHVRLDLMPRLRDLNLVLHVLLGSSQQRDLYHVLHVRLDLMPRVRDLYHVQYVRLDLMPRDRDLNLVLHVLLGSSLQRDPDHVLHVRLDFMPRVRDLYRVLHVWLGSSPLRDLYRVLHVRLDLMPRLRDLNLVLHVLLGSSQQRDLYHVLHARLDLMPLVRDLDHVQYVRLDLMPLMRNLYRVLHVFLGSSPRRDLHRVLHVRLDFMPRARDLSFVLHVWLGSSQQQDLYRVLHVRLDLMPRQQDLDRVLHVRLDFMPLVRNLNRVLHVRLGSSPRQDLYRVLHVRLDLMPRARDLGRVLHVRLDLMPRARDLGHVLHVWLDLMPRVRDLNHVLHVRLGSSQQWDLDHVLHVRLDLMPLVRDLIRVLHVRLDLMPRVRDLYRVLHVRLDLMPRVRDLYRVLHHVRLGSFQQRDLYHVLHARLDLMPLVRDLDHVLHVRLDLMPRVRDLNLALHVLLGSSQQRDLDHVLHVRLDFMPLVRDLDRVLHVWLGGSLQRNHLYRVLYARLDLTLFRGPPLVSTVLPANLQLWVDLAPEFVQRQPIIHGPMFPTFPADLQAMAELVSKDFEEEEEEVSSIVPSVVAISLNGKVRDRSTTS
eukprot:gene28650-37631_t